MTLLLFCCTSITASTGIIRGCIISEESKTPVSGATIEITENHILVTSDRNGYFSFHHLPYGSYHLRIKAIGFMTDSLICNVKNDKQPPLLHIALKEEIYELNHIIVTNKTNENSEWMRRMREKNSIALLNIVTHQSIEKSADITMADAMLRVSGVSMASDQTGVLTKAIIRGMDAKYSLTSINGMALPSPDDRSRYVALDLISSNMIDRLEIYKTLTPEMRGDAIGGLMNIVTYPSPSTPQFSVKLATAYSQIFLERSFLSFNSQAVQLKSPYEKYGSNYYAKGTDFSKDNLSFKQIKPMPDVQENIFWGKKFFHQKLGIVAQAGAQSLKEGSNSFFIVQNDEPQINNIPGITDFTKRAYSINSKRINFYTQVDYHLNNQHYFRLTQLYTRKKDIEARDWVDTSLANGRSGPGTGRIAFSQRSRLHLQSLFHLNLQGDHQINKELSFDWAFLYSIAKGNYPDWAELTANTGRIAGANGSVTQTSVLLAPLNRIWMHNWENEKDISGKISFEPKPFHHHLSVTGGTLLQYRNRKNSYNEYIFTPAFTGSQGQPFSNIYNAVWYDNNGPQNPLGNNNTPGTYTAQENITAYYAEINIHLNKIEIITGFRNEYTYQGVSSSVPPTTQLGQQVKINYDDWLPSFHIRYALNENENIKFAYYKAISRPALYDVTFFNRNYDDYNVVGNPFLKRSKANNFDVRFEWYRPMILDELEIGAFHKQIKNPYEKTLLNASDTLYPIPSGGLSYTPALKITEQLRNYASAQNYGFEISIEKHLNNISVAASYTFTSSHIIQRKKFKQREIPQNNASNIMTITRMQERPLQGQSQDIANINIGYYITKFDWNLQLTGIYTGKRIEEVSGWYHLDNWQKGYVLLNLSMEKTIQRHWKVFARVGNLLNAGTTVYLNNASNAGIPNQTAKGKLLIEKTDKYAQYLFGVSFKL